MRNLILHSEQRNGLSVAAAAVVHNTPAGFETRPEGALYARGVVLDAKVMAVFDDVPSAGAAVVRIKSGSTTVATVNLDDSAQVQAVTAPISTNDVNVGSLLTAEVEVTTIYGTATKVDVTVQVVAREPFNFGCS